MKNRNRRVVVAAAVSLVLLACIVVGIIANPLMESLSLPVSGKGALTRVDNLDLDALRQQYLSQLAVESNRYNFEDERWIILELEGDSLYELYKQSSGYDSFSAYCASEEGAAERAAIEEKQNDFRHALDAAGISYEWKYSYSVLNNGLAIRADGATCRTLSTMEGVTGVYFSETYDVPKVAVTNNANVYTTGIYNTDGVEYSGEGMVVAILDTGLDYRHEAFAAMPQSPAWDKDYVASMMAASPIFAAQATADEVYYNAKIPYAYDYADDDADVYPMYSSHGTHVAGIVAGKSDYVVNGDTGETFIGVAPEAQLVICKVFTDNLDSKSLGGASSIDILAAVSDCVELGVDVINMSLGSSAGFSDGKSNQYLNEVYARVKDAGISLVVAASNDYSSGFGGGNGTNLASNPDSGTVGSPSTYDAALSVASINGQKSSYVYANGDMDQVAFITDASDENGNQYDFIEQLYALTGKDKSEELCFKYVVVGGVGRTTNYTAKIKRELNDSEGYDGTIALIKRGDIAFAEKVRNAMDNGATACIIYNNLSGTIRMSLGEVEDPIPTCSIGMDAGKVFADNAVSGIGTIHVRADLKAGPFMSDFSSWGPTPDLQLRPDITAHGGEITSAVAGGYDVYSGTSMAAPNMAGVIALLREYLKNTTSLSGTALNARVNQILMSTATIALNEEGTPYSPRKQGAGLAGIRDALATESYITVRDSDGNEKDKTKIELYDDKEKKGVYELVFTVHNMTDRDATYRPNTYVMTETIASDKKTVAEKAYLLTDSTIVYTVGGTVMTGDVLTVPAGQSLEVKVTVTLGDEGRTYLDEKFENGMYVEGFVSLEAVGDTKITVGVPYLAFYGDWNDAPLFDYSEYELAESQKDTGIPEEDKLVASSNDTKIYGKYYGDKYIISMGSYIYTLDDTDVQIYPEKEKIAFSMFDKENQHTIYELYMVYAGLLRGAGYMDVEITDAVTGDVLYFKREENVPKSYAGGGSNAGSAILMEIRPDEWGLVNNGRYLVTLKGELDYPGGENSKRNTFDFEFTVDYEAPQILDYSIRYEAYTENKQTKYRIYMDIDVYDNQYVQDVMPCYIRDVNGVNTLTLATENPIPVYGNKGETSRISYEITDIYDEYVKTGKLYLAVEDYAMNQRTYLIQPALALGEAGSISLAEDENLRRTDIIKENTDADKTPYYVYELTLAPNQFYKPTILADKDDAVSKNLTWVVETGSQYVITQNDELFAVTDSAQDSAVLQLVYGDEDDRIVYAEVELKVTGTAKDAPKPEKLMLSPAEDGNNCIVNLNTVDSFDLHPNMTIPLSASVSPWYAGDVEFLWSSSNDAVVSVDENGTVTSHTKGTAYITVEAVGNSRLNKRIKVTVSSDYRIVNYTLYDYYGGPECVIPANLNIMNIDEECFQYHTELKRVVLPSTLTSIPKNAFKGCTNLEEVVIPGKCTTVGESAFEGCQKLTTLELGMFADQEGNISDVFNGTITIGKNAFKNCKALSEIINQKRLTAVYSGAFEGCTSLTSLDLSALRVAGTGAFAKCTGLTSVTLAPETAVGDGMFSGCTGLTEVDYPVNYLPANAFNGCRKLSSVRFTSEDFTGIGEYALANTRVSEITLPNGTYTIGGGAFAGCTKLATVALSEGTHLLSGTQTPFDSCTIFTAYTVPAENEFHSAVDGILCNKDLTELVSVPFAKDDLSSIPTTVNRIASGALAGIAAVREWDLSAYVSVGAYAFAGSGLTSVTLPASMTELPEGIFSGCVWLSEIRGTGSITYVGPAAFSSCTKLESLDLPAVTEVGANAFRYSGLKTLNAPHLAKVGSRAFERTAFTAISFPALTEIGNYAFSSMTSLKTAEIGPVKKMGEYAFSASTRLTDISFAEGTEVIGNYAFYTQSGNYALATVLLPDGVLRIGDYAFANALALSKINLSTVTSIGKYSFAYDSSLASVDLSSATNIGEAAFYSTGLVSVDLPLAETVGDSAFAASQSLTSVTFGALRVLGASAFTSTKLTTVTLPESFASHTYQYVWNVLDEKGRVDQIKSRYVDSYGIGAFAGIDTLTEILVASSDGDFLSIDGVLYARSADGLVLLQYPAARPGASYTLADGTVSVAGSAFEGVSELTSVEFPYTVKRIGAYAFYQASVKNYTFNSVEAPVLLSEYVDPATLTPNTVLRIIFEDSSTGEGLGSTVYYANFSDFVALQTYAEYFNPEYYQAQDFGLHLVIPQNGTGYDTQIWTGFFSDIRKTETIGADDTTHAAWEAIDEMAQTPLETITGATALPELEDISEKVLAARRAYNLVTLSDQKALCADRAETLLRYESALRDAKSRLGSPVLLDRLVLESVPDKIRYQAGESFDPTGMVIKAVYSDESEVILTSDLYTLDKTVLQASDDSVTVSFTDRGTVYTVAVRVNVQSNGSETETGETETSPEPSEKPGNTGMPAFVWVLIAVGAAVLVGGAVIFVILSVKKKKGE